MVRVVREYANHDSLTCYEAVKALAVIPIREPGQVIPLIELLKKDDELLNRAAADALAAAPAFAVPAVPALRENLKKEDTDIRLASAFALAWLSETNEPIEVILAILKTGDDHQRAEAIARLGQLGRRAAKAVPILESVTEADCDLALRTAALEAIAAIARK